MLAALALAVLSATAPDDATRTLLGRADAALALGDVAAAARDLDLALTIDPDDVDVLYAAASLALRFGRPEAVELLGHLVKLDPWDDEARLQLALAQWRAGDGEAARGSVATVLERHPGLPAAVEVQHTIEGAPAAPRTAWRAFGRLDLAGGYDSNLSLVSTALPSVSRQAVPVGLVDVALGATYDTPARPFSIVARLATLQALQHRATAMASAATVAELGVVGRRQLGEVESVLDVRYDEVFTDGFATHRQRVVSPSVYASVGMGESQHLRVLVGGDYRQALSAEPGLDGGGVVEPSSLVGRAGVRDTLVVGRWQLVLDGLARVASPEESSASPGASREVAFHEVGGQAYLEGRVSDSLAAFALTGYAYRGFREGDRAAEQTLTGQLGARLALGLVELHAEYAYVDNRTPDAAWRWRRHLLVAGVRLYTP